MLGVVTLGNRSETCAYGRFDLIFFSPKLKNKMKALLVSILLCLFSVSSQSQITATTSAGKKVILNMNGTWKYADGESLQEKPCQKNHTGNLTVKNNTDTVIYFYYTPSGTYSSEKEFVKIRPKSSKTINDLESSDQNIDYNWTATYELQLTNIPWNRISGIGKGMFVIIACEVAELEVE